ncbi:hypothetical protein GCM10023258_30380 [Terrabacter aeriphilus]|uniref:Uncharacterized protein n=1 Tax=Terrabacter aeriphilus TaxID=515662 RepID=A0ABP9JJF1_9MICO
MGKSVSGCAVRQGRSLLPSPPQQLRDLTGGRAGLDLVCQGLPVREGGAAYADELRDCRGDSSGRR